MVSETSNGDNIDVLIMIFISGHLKSTQSLGGSTAMSTKLKNKVVS